MKLRPANDSDGRPVSFATLMELKPADGDDTGLVYVSTTKAFEPGGPERDLDNHPRAYGGHVYAQAVWACAQTVGEGFLVSSVSGFFILMGFVEAPFTYTVRILRDGRSYCVRAVDVTQGGEKGVTFTATCSFKKEDANPIEFQEFLDINNKYASVLHGKRPEDHPAALSTETVWFKENKKARRVAAIFPGLLTQKVDMQAYNEHRTPLERRRLLYYSAIGDMPPLSASPNLHACAHLYASDRNSLFTITESLDLGKKRNLMASLNHTVIFHTSAKPLCVTSLADGKRQSTDKWFLQEAWTDRLGDGRGAHHSRMWDPQGRHIATTIQDGLFRLKFNTDEDFREAKEFIERGKPKI